MPGMLKKITDFIKYKEKQNDERGFELLEDVNEDFTQDYTQVISQDASIPKDQAQNQKNKTHKPSEFMEDWKKRKKNEKTNGPQNNVETVSNDLNVNLQAIKQKFGIPQNKDFFIREFKIGRQKKAFIVYVEEMIDKQTLNLSIFPHLMAKDVLNDLKEENPADYLVENVLAVNSLQKMNSYSEIIKEILGGSSALFVEGCTDCIVIETRGFQKRNIDKPLTETVIMGPQEGFTENLKTNLSLIRRLIKNRKFMIEMLPVGNTNNSNCAVMYIDGIANQQVINEVMKRIKSIDADFVMGTGMIEQFIEDNSFMLLWPQVLTTERPDRVASFLTEGQVVIIGDGMPFAITVPITFFHLFHSSEDNFLRWPLGNFLRLIRIVGFYGALLLPGLYVAMVLYHPEMIPTELLASIAKAKENVPFPTLAEVMFMDISFELIREGGIRVPSIIGQTLGIVGALILGQAAVSANLVSPVLIIIVALSGLCNFVIPNYQLALSTRILKFVFIFGGTFLGFYGISLILFIGGILTCSMKSFGVPFLAPIAPKTKTNPDVVLRTPIWMQKNRPDYFNTPDRKRQGNNKTQWTNEKDESDEGGGDKS
jgi:spore germination protein KA